MSQSQKVLLEAGKLNVLDTSGDSADRKVESVTANKELASGDSGKVFLLNSASGVTVGLPSMTSAGSGWNAKFVIGTAPTSANCVVTENVAADTNIVHGGIASSNVAASISIATAGTGVTQVNFLQSVASIGDYVELIASGTNWIIASGVSQVNNSVFLS